MVIWRMTKSVAPSVLSRKWSVIVPRARIVPVIPEAGLACAAVGSKPRPAATTAEIFRIPRMSPSLSADVAAGT